MRHSAAIALTWVLLALCACTSSPPPAPVMPDPASQMPALENRIVMLVEEQRLKIDPKARPLVLDPELAKVARARAADMAAKNYLAHEGPNRETSASLLMAADAKWQGLLGENLAAQHYTRQGGVTVADFAERFLETWLNSPPHKENLAFANYDRTGVGAAVNGDTVYVAQLFSTDLGLAARSEKTAITRYESAKAATAAPGNPLSPPLRLRGAEGVK